ncbi:MAG: alanine--glyoxylate aminotransferase family protein, partial [Halomonas sp.]|nr:alanine--glyoxylate aminotransferase family protein [Halomonas sp.]
AADLRKWLSIMETYENGGHAYHATMPTDGLARLRDIMLETADYGFDKVCEEQWVLGRGARELLTRFGYRSVAAPGFEAPGVVVCYTNDADIGAKFADAGLQVAGGVPLMCDEGDAYRAFRIGLFGLDKLHDVERSLANLETALVRIG